MQAKIWLVGRCKVPFWRSVVNLSLKDTQIPSFPKLDQMLYNRAPKVKIFIKHLEITYS